MKRFLVRRKFRNKNSYHGPDQSVPSGFPSQLTNLNLHSPPGLDGRRRPSADGPPVHVDDGQKFKLEPATSWTALDDGPSTFLISGRKWTADRTDRPPHGRIWTTDHKKIRNVDGGGRVDESPSVEACSPRRIFGIFSANSFIHWN